MVFQTWFRTIINLHWYFHALLLKTVNYEGVRRKIWMDRNSAVENCTVFSKTTCKLHCIVYLSNNLEIRLYVENKIRFKKFQKLKWHQLGKEIRIPDGIRIQDHPWTRRISNHWPTGDFMVRKGEMLACDWRGHTAKWQIGTVVSNRSLVQISSGIRISFRAAIIL